MPVSLLPYLLIDVDGVLAPVVVDAAPPGYVRRTVQASNGRRHTVWLNLEHGDWLTALRDRFELVWATGWEHDAASILEPILGLAPMTVIEFTHRPALNVTLRKLPDVVAFVGDRPAAWVDDDLDPETEKWAMQREAPTMLIATDRATGLTLSHVRQLLDFSDRVASGPGRPGLEREHP